jgi:hypothetical protein
MQWIILLGLLTAAACSSNQNQHEVVSSDESGDSGTFGDDTDNAAELGDAFRFGINGGHRNADWGDDVQAELEARAGCNSQRISLPERHLNTWGYDIEVNDMKAYASSGMSLQVAFLTEPIREHSTAPDTAEDWELAYYTPKGLYAPVTLEDGGINPDNYWAKYVFDTVSMYKEWIKVWEIWNEPDYVSDWNATLTWRESPPTKEQLVRFNGSIFEYIRMLRVSREAARLADKDALIATGGIGYETFLNALLRYTDNPDDGSVTDEYPTTGGAYFDVLSFHHYPIYTSGNADDAVKGYLDHFAALTAELDAAGKVVRGFENTETGAPHLAVGDYPGGDAYARQYLMKVMISAQQVGIDGIDWFVLSDGAAAGESDDPYSYMGLYEDVVNLSTIDEAAKTDAGLAYSTLGMLLNGATMDADRTAALPLSDSIKGAVYQTRDGKSATALWVANAETGDSAVEVEIPSTVSYTGYLWDAAATGESFTVVSNGTSVLLPVTSDVTIYIAD